MDRNIPQKMVIKSKKGHKVDEKISTFRPNFRQRCNFTQFFWIGKNLADIITRKILHESEFCSMYSCF